MRRAASASSGSSASSRLRSACCSLRPLANAGARCRPSPDAPRSGTGQALLRDEPEQRFEQLDRRLVGPVQVVHHHDQRAPARLVAQHLGDRAAGHASRARRRPSPRGARSSSAASGRPSMRSEEGQEVSARARAASARRASAMRSRLLRFVVLVAAARPAPQQIRRTGDRRDCGPSRASGRAASRRRAPRRRWRARVSRRDLPSAGLGDEVHDAAAPRVERAPARRAGRRARARGRPAPRRRGARGRARAVHAGLARTHLEAAARASRRRAAAADGRSPNSNTSRGAAMRLGVHVDLAALGDVRELVRAIHVLAHHRVLADERAADVARDAVAGGDARVHVESRVSSPSSSL